jgi:hypothetical protein
MEQVKLTISGLRADVENGLTRVEMATKYNLPVVQIKKAMDQAGLKNAKPKAKPGFILVDDTATEIVEEVLPTANVEVVTENTTEIIENNVVESVENNYL